MEKSFKLEAIRKLRKNVEVWRCW